MDAHGLPLRAFVTEGTAADCKQAGRLIEGMSAQYLLADRGYDSDEIIKNATNKGMISVIPPRKNRHIQRPYDKELFHKQTDENSVLFSTVLKILCYFPPESSSTH